METVFQVMRRHLDGLYIPEIQITDIFEILILAVLFYFCISWVKKTRAYNLLKGIYIIAIFIVIVNLCQMTTLLWILKSISTVVLIAIVVIFQPELR